MSAKEALRLGGAIVVAAFCAAAAGQLASASVYAWSDSATAWAAAADWTPSGGPPGSGDVARFVNTTTYANAPNITASTTIGSLWVTGAAPLTIGRTGFSTTLTLSGAAVNGNANAGIEMDPGAGALTIDAALVLGGAQTWLNNSSSLLTDASGYALNNNGNSLTIAGSGNVAMGGAISGGGALVQNSGFLALSAINSYTGGTTVSGGTLALATGSATGIIRGNLTINGGGTVSAPADWGLGWGDGSPCVSAIAINGGVLNFTGATFDGGMSAAAVTMTGGTISGTTPDWYAGTTDTPTLTSNASTATAVISSGFTLRLSSTGYVTFNVSQGTTGGADLLISGAIATNSPYGGSGGIVKTGAGLLTLTGANTYAGSTTISGGTLQLGDGTAGHDGSLATSGVANNSVLAYDLNGNQTAAYAVSGSGALTKTGGGALTLSGSNSYTGGTTIGGGTLQTTNANSIGNGAATVNGGVLTVNYGSGGYAFSNAITGSGTVNLTAANAGFVAPSFAPSSMAGFTGTIAINTGFNNVYYALTPPSGATFDGSACNWIVNNQNANSFVYTGTGVALVRFGALSGNGTVSACYQTGSTLEVGALGANTTFSGVLEDNTFGGVLTLTKVGSGTLSLTGPSTFTGSTTPSAGTLAVGNALALQNSTVVLNAGDTGALALTVPAVTLGGLSGARNLNIGGATLSVGNNNGGSVYSGNLSGAGGLTKVGGGALILSGSNSYQGPTIVSAGTLRLQVNGTLPAGTKIMPVGDSITWGYWYAGGVYYGDPNAGYRGILYQNLTAMQNTFQFVGTSNANPGSLPTTPVNQTYHDGWGGWTTGDVLGTYQDGFNNGASGNIGAWLTSLAGSGQSPTIITMMIGTNDPAFGGWLVSQGTANLSAIVDTIYAHDPGVRLLLAQVTPRTDNSYDSTWLTSYNAALPGLVAQKRAAGDNVALVDMNTNFPANGMSSDGLHPNAIGYSWMASQWTSAILASEPGATTAAIPPNSPTTVAAGACLDLAGNSASIGPLGGAGSIGLGAGGALVVDGTAGSNTTFSGSISGAGSFTKTGPGELVLSGSNSYSGGTTVSGGTLEIAAPSALAGSGLVTIGSGARLVLGSGAGIGALLAASPPVSSAAVALSAAASLPTTLDGDESGSENMTTLGGDPSFSQGGGGSAVGGSAAAVPEPGALALLAAGAAAAAAVRRKRKK